MLFNATFCVWNNFLGVMVHPLGDYACQPSDSTIVAHALTACYYLNGAAYTNGSTQSISNSIAKVGIDYKSITIRGLKNCVIFC